MIALGGSDDFVTTQAIVRLSDLNAGDTATYYLYDTNGNYITGATGTVAGNAGADVLTTI